MSDVQFCLGCTCIIGQPLRNQISFGIYSLKFRLILRSNYKILILSIINLLEITCGNKQHVAKLFSEVTNCWNHRGFVKIPFICRNLINTPGN